MSEAEQSELEILEVLEELLKHTDTEFVMESGPQVSSAPTGFSTVDDTEPVNGCDNVIKLPPPDDTPKDTIVDHTTILTSESSIINTEEESNTPKTSRELKSILALSKEANLDTNLSPNRRKSESKSKLLPKKTKMTNFPVTAESELENFEVKVEDKKLAAKKRKSTLSDTPIEGSSDEAKKGLPSDFVMPRKPNKDVFCWRCHIDDVQLACETCPRSYHLKCLKQTVTDTEHWPCPECVAILKAENTQTRSKAMKGMSLEHLCSLLKFAVKRMIQCNGSEPFIHPVDENQFPEYKNYIINPMTLSTLEKNLKENLYGSTQGFESDAKWILHNSIIFNSYFPDQSKLTTAAKTILKVCKQEMAEIENCPSCYLNANTKKHTWFIEVCPRPHLLVWAKLKGFPYWPAKVMSINTSGMADVRFFGAHDRAWVSVKDCYLYSVKDPNSGKQKRNDIIECVKELELYVDNLRQIYGRVNFAPFKTVLDGDNQLKQLQIFLPSYRDDSNEILQKKIKEALDRCLNKEDSSSENLSETDYSYESTGDDDGDETVEDSSEVKMEDTELINKKLRRRRPKKLNSNQQGMTRIDYRSSTDTMKTNISSPNRNKRHSSEDIHEESNKISRCGSSQRESNRVFTNNQIKPRHESPSKPTQTNEGKDDDEKPSKVEENTNDLGLQQKSEEEASYVANESIQPVGTEEKQKDDEFKITKSPGSSMNDDDDDKVEDMVVEIDEANIRSIIHSSLVEPVKEVQSKILELDDHVKDKETGKKRKREDLLTDQPDKKDKEEEQLFPPNKMVKLVPIENILQKKPFPAENSTQSSDQFILLKEIRMVKDGKELNNKKQIEMDSKKKDVSAPSLEIKHEVESDEDNSDVQYMEAKRQYLSALNISEKQKVPSKPKGNEIRTRSKTEEKKNRLSVDNLSRTIDEVATSRLSEPYTKPEPIKEIYIKSVSKMQASKHKARKSFPTPNYTKKTIVARKIVPKPGATSISSTDDEVTVVNASTLQPTANVMILPKLHYNKPSLATNEVNHLPSPPALAVLPRTDTTLTTPPTLTSIKRNLDNSQNYIPQNEGDQSELVQSLPGVLLNNLLATNTSVTTTPIIDLENLASSQLDPELGVLKEILPETLTKGVTEILCQPPPKLRPKPVGILNNLVDLGVPSSAGPVASRINTMAQKLSDYFRSLLVETISDLGKSTNSEAAISNLKFEIEELNHRHSMELAEIRRNVSIVLKDIQKSVVEERERIINETRANCDIELSKRVDEAKSKQWCANCSKEAQFYCCWNTSYCDYPCQQKHWLKHMSKCTQTSNQNNQSSTSTPVRTSTQQLILTPTAPPKFGALFTNKPSKVYIKKTTPGFKPATGSHITLVESTPGNFELLSSSSSIVNGKIIASTYIEKVKSGSVITATAPSNASITQLTSATPKVNIVAKSVSNASDSEH